MPAPADRPDFSRFGDVAWADGAGSTAAEQVLADLPAPTATGLEALTKFNARWAERLALHRRLAPPPWWAPGLILTPSIHATYERCLPVARWRTELALVLKLAFPTPMLQPVAWLSASWASLPALWRELPPAFAGRVTVAPERLLALACALASPLRFGTAAGRYPEQRALIRDWRAARCAVDVDAQGYALDIGCGTGQGTWELATWLAERTAAARTAGGSAAGLDVAGLSTQWQVAGLTLEPLEAWMAGQRWLPNLASDGLEAAFPFPPWPPSPSEPAPPSLPLAPRFGAASIFALPCPSASIDLLVCNGLAGGPALRRPADIAAAWRELARVLAPGGLLLIGNTFHGGRSTDVAAFHAAAEPTLRRGAEAGRTVAWQRVAEGAAWPCAAWPCAGPS